MIDSKQTSVVPMVRPEVQDIDRIVEQMTGILRSGRLTNGGPFSAEFEAALAAYLGCKDAVAVSNGAVAIRIAIEAAAVPRGKAILPSFTFIATLNAALHAGFEPVFCDIDPETWTMDPEHLRQLLREHRATLILPVNVFGVPPALDEINALASAAGAAVVYDCAHGMGIESKEAGVCAAVKATTFSFHATKVLVGAEAGAIVSSDEQLLTIARRLRNHGLAQPGVVAHFGFNAKLDELRATVALASLRHLPDTLARRRDYFTRLRAALARHPSVYRLQRTPDGLRPNGQNLGVWTPDLPIDEVIAAFSRHGVEARRYFYPPLHTLPQWSHRAELPRTERLCAAQFCLPLHSTMDEPVLTQIETAIDAVARELGPQPPPTR